MSPWYAIAALSDARDATEALLRPLDRGRWLRLALVALFVGVGGGVPTGGGNVGLPSGGGGAAPSDLPSPTLPDPGAAVAVAAAVAVVLVAVVVVWSVVGAVMEFVLVAGLRDREVRIRRPFRAHFRRGLRLFGFRLAVGLGSLLVVALPVALVITLGVGLSPVLLVLLLPLLVLFGVVALLGSLVLGLTTDFVVPTMLTEDVGVLDGWRRVWPVVREQWKQTAVYLVAKFALGIGVGIAVSLAVLLAALVVAVPFAVVGGGLFLALSAAGAGAGVWVAVGLVAALFVLVMIVVGLLIQVPALTFVRYYSLSVLGLFDPDLDLVGVDRPGDGDGDENGDGNGDGDENGDGNGDGDENGDADDLDSADGGRNGDADDLDSGVAGSPGSTGGYRSPSCRRSVVSISGWRA
jgi:hypothetical protein